jgi:hypothetical protein
MRAGEGSKIHLPMHDTNKFFNQHQHIAAACANSNNSSTAPLLTAQGLL